MGDVARLGRDVSQPRARSGGVPRLNLDDYRLLWLVLDAYLDTGGRALTAGRRVRADERERLVRIRAALEASVRSQTDVY
jgi:hypothetical protein